MTRSALASLAVLICCDTPVSRKYLRSDVSTVIDEVETPVGGESAMLREVHNDGLAVDAEADVFNRISAALSGRCCWNCVRTAHRYLPIHFLLAGGSMPPHPFRGFNRQHGLRSATYLTVPLHYRNISGWQYWTTSRGSSSRT